jgi:hypothetical protein
LPTLQRIRRTMTALHKPEASREPSPVIDEEVLEHDATRSQSEDPEQPPLIEIEEPGFHSPVERIRRITTPSPTYRQPIEMSLNFYLRCSRFVEQPLCRKALAQDRQPLRMNLCSSFWESEVAEQHCANARRAIRLFNTCFEVFKSFPCSRRDV